MSRPDELRPGALTQGESHSFRWLDPREAESEQVLARLLSEAASQIPGLSSDPSLTDPLVRLLLAAVAKEYTHLYRKFDEVIDTAYRQLVDSVLTFPRAPQPSSTVLQLGVTDGGTVVDENLVVIGRKAMPDGETFKERNIHFAPYSEERVPGLQPPVVLRQTMDGTVSLCAAGAPPAAGQVDPGPANWLHVGFALPAGFEIDSIPLFLQADDGDLVTGLIWSTWQIGEGHDGLSFVPGIEQGSGDWDGRGNPPLMRSRSDVRRPKSPFDRSFVHIPVERLRRGDAGLPAAVTAATAAGLLAAEPRRHWVSIRCAEHLDPEALVGASFRTNCIVAFNLQTAVARFKIGRALSEVVDLPETYDQIFRVDEIRDAANVTHYADAETSAALRADAVYHLDHHPSGLVRLRLMTRTEPARPRAIEVMYTTISGAEANGLAAGSVDTVYDRRLAPGVADAVNITASAGGLAAPQREWLATELRAQLATRGRAVTRHDFEVLTRAYDPKRIHDVEVGRGVMRGTHGVTSCVQVTVGCSANAFHGELERTYFVQGLQQYLEARSPADLQVLVNLEPS